MAPLDWLLISMSSKNFSSLHPLLVVLSTSFSSFLLSSFRASGSIMFSSMSVPNHGILFFLRGETHTAVLRSSLPMILLEQSSSRSSKLAARQSSWDCFGPCAVHSLVAQLCAVPFLTRGLMIAGCLWLECGVPTKEFLLFITKPHDPSRLRGSLSCVTPIVRHPRPFQP